MKYAILAARLLMGACFVFFGANLILGFLKMPLPSGDAGTFQAIMAHTGWMKVVGLLQIIGGLLLLVGRFVPLALVILCPVIVNIFLFHLFLEPKGLPLAILLAVLAAFLIFVHRLAFRGLLLPEPEAVGTRGL